jgi:hypothetical protein
MPAPHDFDAEETRVIINLDELDEEPEPENHLEPEPEQWWL